MIDTEKYKGHTPAEEWDDIVYAANHLSIFLNDGTIMATDLDRQLMAAAPRLLAEVIRLRSFIAHHDGGIVGSFSYRQCAECGSLDFIFKFDAEGMECKCDKCDNIWRVKIE